jgi:hypothetical protein
MIQASLGSDNQTYFVAMGSIYGLLIRIYRLHNHAYTHPYKFGMIRKVYFSLRNTSFDGFRGMEGSDIILVVPRVNNKVIWTLYDRNIWGS